MSSTEGVITAIPAPDGYVLDFNNPARQGNIACYWVYGVGNLLALFFVIQRMYVKFLVRKNFGLDDAFLLIAWVFSITIQSMIVRGFIKQYLGVHAWEIPITQFMDFFKYSVYLNPIIYAPPTALSKQVLLMFFLNINNREKWFQWSVYSVMFMNLGCNAGIMFSSIFACSPIEMGWDLTIVTGTCINRTALFEATAALGVILDLLIIAIPIPMVIRLQMSRSKKVGLIFMFTIGSATVITSIVRLILLMTSLGSVDQTWGGGPISVWICVEANLLIMCACLPTLRLFIRTVAPGIMSSLGRSADRSKPSKYGARSNTAPQTIGGSSGSRLTNPKRQHYGRFDEETELDNGRQDYPLETFVAGNNRQTPDITVTSELPPQTSSRGHPRNGSTEWKSDDDSEKGIVQTRTTQITYSNAHAY